MMAADLIATAGRTSPVICFEPGASCEVLRSNIEINGFAGRVIVEPLAV